MRDLLIAVATRERQDNAKRLIDACQQTCTADTDLIFGVDSDDPSYPDLNRYGLDCGWRMGTQVLRGPRQDVAGWTDTLAVPRARLYRAVASLGDDHVPQTKGWDDMLLTALGDRMGVAYGNDLWQGQAWPTAAVVSAPVITALGYMAPPGVEHLYIDCFWKRLGEDLGCLEYLDTVIIEHKHPHAGTAAWDPSYMRSNSITQYSRDEAAYQSFLANRWPDDLAKLRERL